MVPEAALPLLLGGLVELLQPGSESTPGAATLLDDPAVRLRSWKKEFTPTALRQLTKRSFR